MAGNIRIRKLARRLGRRPDEVLRALSGMGLERYLSPDDAISTEVAGRVEIALSAPEPGGSSEPSDFDTLMRSQGVQKLAGRHGPKRPGAKASGAAGSATPARVSQPVRPAQPARPAPPASRSARARRPPGTTAELLGRIEQLQERVRGLEMELGEARRQAEDTGADTDRARAALVTMFSHLEVRDRFIEDLRQRLDAAGLTNAPRVETPLGAALVERGLLGPDEHTRAIQGLLEARRWPQLSGVLGVSRPEVLQTLLRERIVLQCGRPRCAVPRFTIPVRVPPSRCEVCGGAELPSTMRRLSDTLLLNGWTRLLVLGGGPGEHRLLSELLDERIAVSGISGRAPVVPRDALDAADCVVLWSGAEPDRALVESLERALESGVVSPRVSRRPERGLGAMSLALIQDLSDQPDGPA